MKSNLLHRNLDNSYYMHFLPKAKAYTGSTEHSILDTSIYSKVQKKLVSSHFTHVAYIEYYLKNACLCGYLIDKHMKISYIDSNFFKLFNEISFVTIEQYFLLIIVMGKYRTFL